MIIFGHVKGKKLDLNISIERNHCFMCVVCNLDNKIKTNNILNKFEKNNIKLFNVY